MNKLTIAWPKIKASITNLLTLFIAFLGPKAVNFLYAIGIAVVIDNILAIYHVVYYEDKKKFLSERFFSGFIIKTLVYLLILTLCVYLGRITNVDIIYIVSGGILFNEIKSIDEKFNKLFGFSLFTKILDIIGKTLNIDKTTKNINKDKNN